jgi:hypothetical protein
MSTLEEIHRHVDAAGGDDPRTALIAVRKLINDDVPWLERRAVQLAGPDRWDWPRISRPLLRSRQAVRQRFGAIEAQAVPVFASDDPHAKLQADAERVLQRWRDAQARREAREAVEHGGAEG